MSGNGVDQAHERIARLEQWSQDHEAQGVEFRREFRKMRDDLHELAVKVGKLAVRVTISAGGGAGIAVAIAELIRLFRGGG